MPSIFRLLPITSSLLSKSVFQRLAVIRIERALTLPHSLLLEIRTLQLLEVTWFVYIRSSDLVKHCSNRPNLYMLFQGCAGRLPPVLGSSDPLSSTNFYR